jgi:uncharacterized protein
MPEAKVDEQLTCKVAEQWFGSMKRLDFASALVLIAPDVEWINIPPIPLAGLHDIAPWFGTYHGKEAVLKSFDVFGQCSSMLDYEVYDIFVKGDKALALTHEHAQCHANGLEYDLYIANEIVVRDGLVVKWQVYWDPTPLIAAYQDGLPARLVDAVRQADLPRIENLLHVGANVDAVDAETGMPVLAIAAGLGHEDVLRRLIERGADVFATDRIGASALHKACQDGSLANVKLLVESGALLDQQTATTGHTPLIEAMWFTWPEVVAYLLDQDAGLAMRTHYGFSIDDHLDYALKVNPDEQEQLKQIQALLAKRRARDQERQAGQKLMAAVIADDLAAVKQLIADGADLHERAPHLNGFNDGHTPLHVAARDGHTAIVKELLAAGADVNAVEPTFGAVPLHKATYNGHGEITGMLARQPGVNLDYPGPSNGYTPLLDALWHGFDECARVLIEAGARLDWRGHDGADALALAREVLGERHNITKLIEDKLQPAAGAGAEQ